MVICEVGGTVGDIESEPFLEAIRQMRRDVGVANTLFIHVTLLPYIGATHELKTKPTQHSVKELLRAGIQPDVILCRADYEVSDEIRDKIALFCNIDRRAVIPLVTARSIYEVPLMLEDVGLGDFLVESLRLQQDAAGGSPGLARAGRAHRDAESQYCVSRWWASTSACMTPTSRSRNR